MARLNTTKRAKILIASFVSGLLSFTGNTQVNELKTASVYEYLYRMAQKGNIRFADYQLPLDRTTIASAIDSLSTVGNKLSKTESKELEFYQREYSFDHATYQTQEKVLFRKDETGRFRAVEYVEGGAKIFIDPLIGAEVLAAGNRSARQYFSGIRLAGYFGKKWGFNFSFRDITEKGDTLTKHSSFSPLEGIVPTLETQATINYSKLNYNIGYKWSSGSLSAGQENLSWGYGIGGNIALSGRAPSFPFVKFDFSPWSWLHFSYFHGWLQSNLIDSARSYNTRTGLFGGERLIYYPKFIAHHALTATPLKGLDIAIGESIIYSDKLNIAYLIPLNFFKAYDQYNSRYNINAGDNSQFFGFISSRNHLKNTHIYAQIFIDELRASKIFDKKERRNQLGYTFGVNRTDLFLHYLTAGIEYSRINPFVYNNLIPTQTYESQSYLLGDWMGSDADRLFLFVYYVPLPKLQFKLWCQKIRKGDIGTLNQQYTQKPQPRFLFKKSFDYSETGLSMSYEFINRLTALIQLNSIALKYTNTSTDITKGLRFGFEYGL